MSDVPTGNAGSADQAGIPRGASPDPDNPGWYSWGDFPRGSFAGATGRLLFKPDGPGRGIARMFPTESHMNMGGSLHGETTVARGDSGVIDFVVPNYARGAQLDDDLILLQAFYPPQDTFTVTLQRPDGSRLDLG